MTYFLIFATAFSTSSNLGEEMVAFKNFDASNESYLSLQVGDEILLLSPPEDGQGWSYGKSKQTNRIGWFPPAFVIPRISARRVLFNWEPTPNLGEGYIPLRKGDLILQLPPPEKDQGWAYGKLNTDRKGWFPPDFTKPFSNQPSDANLWLEEGTIELVNEMKADDCDDRRLMKRYFNAWPGSTAYDALQRKRFADSPIQGYLDIEKVSKLHNAQIRKELGLEYFKFKKEGTRDVVFVDCQFVNRGHLMYCKEASWVDEEGKTLFSGPVWDWEIPNYPKWKKGLYVTERKEMFDILETEGVGSSTYIMGYDLHNDVCSMALEHKNFADLKNTWNRKEALSFLCNKYLEKEKLDEIQSSDLESLKDALSVYWLYQALQRKYGFQKICTHRSSRTVETPPTEKRKSRDLKFQ